MAPPRPLRLSRLRDDEYLAPYRDVLESRRKHAAATEKRLTGGRMTLADFACGHEYFGVHREKDAWVIREWAPNAEAMCLVGPFSDWRESDEFSLRCINERGVWEGRFGLNSLHHGELYKLRVWWPGGEGERIPAYARRVVQDDSTHIFCAQVWAPDESYAWQCPRLKKRPDVPLIYEVHVGMAQQEGGVGTYARFEENILPRIVDAGYNTIQLMAVMEHPYYGSFGYHVANFFAASSRFGTPEELKSLVDRTHTLGLAVVMDLVHSHSVRNSLEGLSQFDGTDFQYFHKGERGYHSSWDSLCFDYSKPEVLHFLLSNCRFWLDEYFFDGFRFDGVTSMLYHHHGIGPFFTSYDGYFDESVDEDAMAYLTLANKLIHATAPGAVTIAEDVSGMPGLAAPINDGGCGFDYRLAMGVTDCWFKLLRDVRDEDWDVGWIWHELTNRRADERTISYAECHDQAIVGGKTIIFQLIDADMYSEMRVDDQNIVVDRGIALHKMVRLATLATAGHGYLNFMGNEFGHPEWIDFPREGNNWSYHYARRQWRLCDNPELKYHFLADFDKAMLDVVEDSGVIVTDQPRQTWVCNDDKVLAFVRGSLLFVFNFHPTNSYPDYGIVSLPGEYVLLLDTDEDRFGGHERLFPAQHYCTRRGDGEKRSNRLLLYLPSRTALVLRRL